MGVKRILFVLLMVGFIASHADAQFNRHRRRGTIIGGIAGAAIGAAITDRRNDAAGVLLGGTAGAMIGRSIGAERDRKLQQNYQYHRHYAYPHVNRPVQTAPPVVVAPVPVPTPAPVPYVSSQPTPISQTDVVEMVQSGLSEKLIAAEIQRRGIGHQLDVQDIIHLHQQGVSEWLIQWMQNSVIPHAPSYSQTIPVETIESVEVESHTSYQAPSPISPAEAPSNGTHSSYGTSVLKSSPSGLHLNSAN